MIFVKMPERGVPRDTQDLGKTYSPSFGRRRVPYCRVSHPFLRYNISMSITATFFSYALLAGIVPALVWLFFWLREDSAHPEPRWLIGLSFLAGAISVLIAIFGEKYIFDITADQATRYTLWAALEEIIKLAVVIIVALNTPFNDEPIDAMIYIITVALGFSAIENTLFILGPLSGGDVTQSIVTGSLRFVGATLVHTVSSAIIGFAIGYAFYRNKATKFIAAIIGLAGAVILHASFNLSIINANQNDVLKTFGWIWLAVIVLIILFEEVKAVRPKLP
jgi:RsiW-degrading membrane proteinase PrsW (M82 family)